VDFAKLCDARSRLWHVTFPDAWPSIRDHGLWPASELLRSARRDSDVEAHRSSPTDVALDGGPHATVRDHLSERQDIGASLDGLSPAPWWGLINERVYRFAQERHTEGLVCAYNKKGYAQEIIKVRTSGLRGIEDAIEVTTVNAGAFPHKKGPWRGRHTFVALQDFDARDAKQIREVTVRGRVKVADQDVISVVRVEPDGTKARIFP
jgi:hypothetical protein